jgi:voltage-gated potassium channel Kch
VLLLQDLAVVPLLALLPLLASPETGFGGDIGLALIESLFILVLVVVVGRFLLHPLLHRVARAGSPEVFTASAVLIVLGTAMVTEHAGLSMMMGAFLAGLLISESTYRQQVIAEIQPFRGLLLGLFFMTMGMSLNLELLLAGPFAALSTLVLLLVIKAAVLFPLARLFGLDTRISLAVSLLLAQCGEFALVLFALAAQSGLMTDQRFQSLLIVVLLSMMVTPVLAHMARKLVEHPVDGTAPDTVGQPAAPVVLAGFGPVGRHLGEILNRAAIPFVAVDFDPALVSRERRRGNPVHLRDAVGAGFLESLDANSASMIVVTLDDPDDTLELVASLREHCPDAAILSRGHDLETSRSLDRLGVSGVVSENVVTGLELSRMILERIGVARDTAENVLAGYRDQHQALIEQPLPARPGFPGLLRSRD